MVRTGNAPALLRDVGGIPLADGGELRRGRAYRISGQIVTPEQLEALRQAGVGVVVDLRGAEEDRSVVRSWAQRHGIGYRHEPIPAASGTQLAEKVRNGASPEAANTTMKEAYLWIVDRHGPQIAATLGVISDGVTAGFGCAAGRDRTGIVSALLQSLLGASDEAIAAAYSRDAPAPELLRPQLRGFFGLGPDDPLPPGAEILLGAREEWVLAALDHVRHEHGGVAAYLGGHGLTDEAVAKLSRLFGVDV